MGKTVIKTIIVTLLAIILFLAIVFTCFLCFSPKTLGKFFDTLGYEDLSLHFYESSYEKTKDLSDLYYDVICKIDVKKDSKNAKKYVSEFVSDKDFDEMCAKIDKANPQNGISTKEYVYGKLSASIYFEDGTDAFILKANEAVGKIGYTEYSPYGYLITNYYDDLSTEQKAKLSNAISVIYGFLSGSEKVFADSDLGILG